MNKTDVHIKEVFLDFFSNHQIMSFGKMFFRPYYPLKDSVVKNYSTDDWNLIFNNMTEEDLKDLSECVNVIILLWCDAFTSIPHGMLYLQESHPVPGEITFHGGTWDHRPIFFYEIFRSLLGIFLFLFNYCTTIKTTCGIDNKHADRFQKSFGFIETHRDITTSYKTLNKTQLEKSIIAYRLNK